MADDLNIIGAVDLTTSFSVIGEVLLWGFIVLLVAGILYLLYYLMSFNNTLIIRDAAHKRKIIKKVKWKEKRDANNNIWLVTPFNKIKKALPPHDAIELTAKGKKWIEAYRGEDTETLIWITDDFDYNIFKGENVASFQPLTTQERELLVNEIAKSKAYQKRGLYDTIVVVAMVMAPIILIAVIGLVLGDITEGLNQYAQPLTSTLQSVGQSFENAASSLSCIQTIDTPIIEVPN